MQDKGLSLKDVIREEYKKCAADPVYFMKSIVRFSILQKESYVLNYFLIKKKL